MVVQDGVMYFHTQQRVFALEAKTGRTLWASKPTVPFNGSARGVTVAGGLVLAGLSDTSVVALRADTGDPAWIYKGADVAPGNGYISSPPAVGNGVAVIPVSGGDGTARPHHRRRRQDRQGTVDVLRRSRDRAKQATRPGRPTATCGDTAAAPCG